MHNHSYENEFNLQVNERMSTKTRFEKDANINGLLQRFQGIRALWKNNAITIFVASVIDNELAQTKQKSSIVQARTRPKMCFY